MKLNGLYHIPEQFFLAGSVKFLYVNGLPFHSHILVNYFIGIFDVQLFPYGNATETKTADGQYHYKCDMVKYVNFEFGPSNCTGNFVEACIIDVANSEHRDYFPTISCIEQKIQELYDYNSIKNITITSDDVMDVAQTFWKLHMPDVPFSQIENCVNVRFVQHTHRR